MLLLNTLTTLTTALFALAEDANVASIENVSIPLIVPSGPESTSPFGGCLQEMRATPLISEVEFPDWLKLTYDEMHFIVKCELVGECTAIADADLDASTLAKFFLITYRSEVHVKDWRNAQYNDERMEVVNYFWETGRFQDALNEEKVKRTRGTEGLYMELEIIEDMDFCTCFHD